MRDLVFFFVMLKVVYKVWIVGALVLYGSLMVDVGAVVVIRVGKSLLLVGVIEVGGVFEKDVS